MRSDFRLRTKFSIGPWIGLLITLLLLAGCGEERGFKSRSKKSADEAAAEAKEQEKDDLIPVEVVELSRGPIEAVLRFSTNLEAESEVQVFSQAARLVTELLVEEGSRVRKGDVLVRLQNDEQRTTLARTESQLKKTRREHERQENLFARELISEKVLGDSAYEVEQLELALEDGRRAMSYTEVRAPISGTITQRMVNLGDNITVNQHLFDMVDFDTIVARVYVPEREIRRLRIGQPARLFSDSLTGEDGEGRVGEVLRIAPIVDARSGTVKVTVKIPGNQGMLPGMYVEVELVIDQQDDALLLPKRAMVYDDTQPFVYRLNADMMVERLLVKPLVDDRDNVRPYIDDSPLSLAVGDRIVVAGQAGLKDGSKVRLAETDRGLLSAESTL